MVSPITAAKPNDVDPRVSRANVTTADQLNERPTIERA
jgi:hypothetical protein